MDERQKLIVRAIFTDPIPPRIDWRAIETFLMQLGCVPLDGRWDRMRFMQRMVVGTFQRTEQFVKPYQIRDVRDYLRRLGMQP